MLDVSDLVRSVAEHTASMVHGPLFTFPRGYAPAFLVSSAVQINMNAYSRGNDC